MKTLLTTFSVVALTFMGAGAQTLFENWSGYPDGALGNQTGTGTGETGTWQSSPTNTGASNLNIGTITWDLPDGYTATSNRGIVPGFGQNGAIQLETPIDFDSNATFYFSALYRRPDDIGGSVGLVELADSSGAVLARPLFPVGGGDIRGQIGNTQTGGTFPGIDQDFVVVARITTVSGAGLDSLEIQVTPGSGVLPTTFTASGSAAMEAVTGSATYLNIFNFFSVESGNARIGELRMAESYAAVIPEPSSAALLLGGLVLMYRSRVSRAKA